MKNKLSKPYDNFSHIVIWLSLYVVMALPQFFMIGMAAMATDSGVPEQSIINTFKAIPFLIFVTFPVLIPLIYSIIIHKRHSCSKIIIILSFIIYVCMADLLAPAFGAYSVNSIIYSKVYEMKKSELEDNHPNKDPNNKHILHTNTYDWYFNESTYELLEVRDITITSLESELTRNTEIEYIAELELTQDLALRIISNNDKGTRFDIEDTNKEYFTSHNLLIKNSIGDNPDGPKIKPYLKTKLIKDDTIISYDKSFDNGILFRDLFNTSLNFKLDGEQILSVNFPENTYDISVIGTTGEYPDFYTQEEKDYLDAQRNKNNKLMLSGNWEVQLFAHSPIFGRIELSEVFKYTIQ